MTIWSELISWKKWSDKKNDYIEINTPKQHAENFIGAKEEKVLRLHIPLLLGISRQPYFDQKTGQLILKPGYNSQTHILGHFNPDEYKIPENPSKEECEKALDVILELFSEFPFKGEQDLSTAVSGVFTAVVRQNLPKAPAFHVRAPMLGSGKSYLCDVIGSFAGQGGNKKVSFPRSEAEMTKILPPLLMENLTAIEFDNMTTDWTDHKLLCTMLTEGFITGRILGKSKTVTLSTRVLILGSGNNVGPSGDMRRRVNTIELDPKSEVPSTRAFKHDPHAQILANRSYYVAAVLTLIQGYIKSGKKPQNICSIGSFGVWEEYCRYPLMWMGLSDPAQSLINQQINLSEDEEAIFEFMIKAKEYFHEIPQTVRSITSCPYAPLRDALKELPDVLNYDGSINSKKLGWLLSRYQNRLIKGLKIEKTRADGRTAWRIVEAQS